MVMGILTAKQYIQSKKVEKFKALMNCLEEFKLIAILKFS